eukprot:529679-Rhodomonas_salina.1
MAEAEAEAAAVEQLCCCLWRLFCRLCGGSAAGYGGSCCMYGCSASVYGCSAAVAGGTAPASGR